MLLNNGQNKRNLKYSKIFYDYILKYHDETKCTPEYAKTYKKLKQYDINGNYIRTFKSFKEAEENGYTYKRIQENLQALKAVKLQELTEAFKEATTKTKVTVSGVGIVDGGRSNLQDITGIIETFEESGEETMPFRIADNSFVSVNAEQLKAIKKAIILKGQELYQKKWEIEAKLANAKTFDEIRAIKVEF